jgi:nicotinamidase-related amidase
VTVSAECSELVAPIGVLAAIRDGGLLREGTTGATTVNSFASFAGRITEISGWRGLDVFANPAVDDRLRVDGVEQVVFAGVLTSVFVDAAARSAVELGYEVAILADCTAPRTSFEHALFCEEIFPMYAEVIDTATFVQRMQLETDHL